MLSFSSKWKYTLKLIPYQICISISLVRYRLTSVRYMRKKNVNILVKLRLLLCNGFSNIHKDAFNYISLILLRITIFPPSLLIEAAFYIQLKFIECSLVTEREKSVRLEQELVAERSEFENKGKLYYKKVNELKNEVSKKTNQCQEIEQELFDACIQVRLL